MELEQITSNTSLADAAKLYASLGWYIFPVKPKDKIPATKQGYKDATNDINQIISWWNTNPHYNIGMVPGRSGLLVLDDDGKGNDIELPQTLTVKTPKKGKHFYFRHPGGHIGNLYWEKGEVRADDGYVLLPPSVHPDTGTKYVWENITNVAEFPDIKIGKKNEIKKKKEIFTIGAKEINLKTYDESALEGWFSKIHLEGDRNDSLASILGTMRERGVSKEAIVSWGKTKNFPPPGPESFPFSEFLRTVDSIYSYEKKTLSPSEFIDKIKRINLEIYQGIGLSTDYIFPGIETNLLPQHQITLFYGKSNSGKSVLSYHLAAAAAAGKPLFTDDEGRVRFTPRKRHRVLYIDSENSRSGINSILKSEEAMLGINYLDLLDDELMLIAPTYEFDLYDISKMIFEMENKPEIVFFDSLNSLVPSFNDEEQVQKIFDQIFMPLRNKLGMTIVILHNASQKTGDHRDDTSGFGPMGSSKFFSLSDTAVHIHFTPDNDDTRKFYISKSRGPQRGESFKFKITTESVGYSLHYEAEKKAYTPMELEMLLLVNVENYSSQSKLTDYIYKELIRDYTVPSKRKLGEEIRQWLEDNTERGSQKETFRITKN